MGRTVRIDFISAALLLSTAVAVAAADFCMETTVDANMLALKGFSLPGKGACKETRGFYIFGPYWVTGMACGSSDGSHITFFQTGASGDGTIMITDTFALNRTALSGSGTECSSGGGFCFPNTWTKIPCSPSTVPVP